MFIHDFNEINPQTGFSPVAGVNNFPPNYTHGDSTKMLPL